MSESPSVFIIHGSYGSPFENWFGWLAGLLVERGVNCFVPSLPTPRGQSYDNWSAILNGYRAGGCFGTETHIIAHSSGCPFVVRYVATESTPLRSLTTVGGFDAFQSGDEAFDNINREVFTRGPSDFASVRDLAEDRAAYFSDDDPYLPQDVLEAFACDLKADVHKVSGGGHFNTASGYTTFAGLFDRMSSLVKEG